MRVPDNQNQNKKLNNEERLNTITQFKSINIKR